MLERVNFVSRLLFFSYLLSCSVPSEISDKIIIVEFGQVHRSSALMAYMKDSVLRAWTARSTNMNK